MKCTRRELFAGLVAIGVVACAGDVDEVTADLAAMDRCLAEEGVAPLEPGGQPFMIRLPDPPPGEEVRDVYFIARGEGAEDHLMVLCSIP